MFCSLDFIFLVLLVILIILIYYKNRENINTNMERNNMQSLYSQYPTFQTYNFDSSRKNLVVMETSNLVKQQIRLQEGIARLSSANTLPSAGLSLLR